MRKQRSVRRLNVVLALVMTAAFVLVPAGSAMADSHHFNVDIHDSQVWGHEFTPGDYVTVEVNDVAAGTFLVDGAGDWGGAFDAGMTPGVGDLVEAQGAFLAGRSLTVAPIAITGVDIDTDDVTGVADPGAFVDVWIHDGHGTNVTADSGGHWTADFSGHWDLVPGIAGAASQCDADGDCTFAHWHVPDPRITVDPETDWVWGDDWLPNTSIAVNAGAESMSTMTDNDGHFELHYTALDLVPGIPIVANDGTSMEIHEITNLTITGVDEAANTVTGTTTYGGMVFGWVHGHGEERYGIGDPWVIDFTGIVDFEPGTAGAVLQCDANGSCTNLEWYIPVPQFTVDPETQNVWGGGWEPNSTITVDLGGWIVTGSTNDDGWFDLHFHAFDITPGSVLEVTDGVSTRTHEVTDLTITGVDEAANTVTGTTTYGGMVFGWVHGHGEERYGIGDPWVIDFTGIVDFEPGTAGAVLQCDANGSCTNLEWYIPRPQFWVQPEFHVGGQQWLAETTITIEHNGSWAAAVSSNESGDFDAELPEADPIEPGDTITVSDGETTWTHVVTPLSVTEVDEAADTVSGLANPFAEVHVWVHVDEHTWRATTADAGGNWTVDFGTPGPGEEEYGVIDLVPGIEGNSGECDPNGMCTNALWRVPRAEFWVDPGLGDIHGSDWLPETSVQVWINGDHAFSFVTNLDGQFGGHIPQAILAGDHVEVTDGTNTKSHDVTHLAILAVDHEDDEVVGAAEPGSEVHIWVHDVGDVWRTLIVPASGYWTADFWELGTVEGRGTTDIVPGSNGNSVQCDDDGDCTAGFWWLEPDRATVEGHVYLDGEPLADVEVWLSPGQFACTDADGYFLMEDADATGDLAATGPVVSDSGCTNEAFVDPDTGHPLLVTYSEPLDLYDGYEYVEFRVERAGAEFGVNLQTIGDCGWDPVDGATVYAYEGSAEFVGLWGEVPSPDDYAAILEWDQPLIGWTGAFAMDPAGYVTVRLPGVTDYFVLLETTDRNDLPLLLGDVVAASDFAAGDHVATAPTVYFEWPLEFNSPPCASGLVGPQDPVRLWRYGTVTMRYVDAPFDDAHTVLVDWGDGTTTVETPEFENGFGYVEASHKYKSTGLFLVTATVVDAEGLSDWSEFRYVAVYNPKGEDLAGKGRYWSPPGSFGDDPTLSATTVFGFKIRYARNHHTVPSGWFTLKIPKADMVFRATSFDYLVVDDGIAYVNGHGTLNGTDGYWFRMTVEDAAVTGGNTDRIRVQILTDLGVPVYDTQWLEDRAADPTRKIKRGWIRIR